MGFSASAIPTRFAAVAVFVMATGLAGCASADEPIFTSPPPPDEFASGLTLSCIPNGYVFAESEGHESAVFHNFSAGDHAHLAIGRTRLDEPTEPTGEAVAVDGRNFFALDDGKRLVEWIDPMLRIEVIGSDLRLEQLSRLASCLTYDPDLDAAAP